MNTLDLDLLKELFDYNGKQLVWRVSRGKVKQGAIAGFVRPTGYRVICINKKEYMAHRLVYKYVNGSIDDSLEIDHINHNTNDNSIDNLRLVTRQENQFNIRCKGYTKRGNKYESTIRVDNVLHYLGVFEKEEDAKQAYLNAKEKYHLIKEVA